MGKLKYEYGTEILYHYCSLNSFMSIIQNKCLWLCDATKSNDSLETYVIEDFMKKFFDEKIKREPQNKNKYEKLKSTYPDLGITPYIVSFSDTENDVSQWRSYADDARGMVIGFRKNAFIDIDEHEAIVNSPWEEKRYSLKKVVYLSDLRSLLDKAVQYNLSDDPTHKLDKMFTDVLLSYYKYNAKTDGFKSERESRIIYFPQYRISKDKWERVSLRNIKFRNANGRLTSYYEMPFRIAMISKIIIGPRNETAIKDIKDFLEINHYNNDIEIEKSNLSYRG